jgi:two-component system, cell cycle response regulator PopA
VAPLPRLLIISENGQTFAPLAEGLERLGWPTLVTASADDALIALKDQPIEAVVLDLMSADDAHQSEALARRLKTTIAPRHLPIIAVGMPDALLETHDFDLILSPPLHPAQALVRIETLVRCAIAQEEFELRQLTFAEFGKTLERPSQRQDPFRILAIGEPAPQCLALSNLLIKGGTEVIGAFTAYTAFDYLHEQSFDAVVLWGASQDGEALSIAAGMRRNTRLFHIPITLCTRFDDPISPTDAFQRGVSDIAAFDDSEQDTAQRIIELARAYRHQSAVRAALDKVRASGLMDRETGLFTGELFASHLLRLSKASKQFSRDLCVCVLRVADSDEVRQARNEGWLDRALPQIGSMIGRLVRAEDTAARIAPEVFALALPASCLHEGQSAAERIAAVIACTAFDAGADQPAFIAEFTIGVAQLQANESAASMLERAAAKSLLPA